MEVSKKPKQKKKKFLKGRKKNKNDLNRNKQPFSCTLLTTSFSCMSWGWTKLNRSLD